MSNTLYMFAKSFVNGRLSADVFADAYIELWKIERDAGILRHDEDNVSEVLSSIFCVADMYVPDDDNRKEYEFDSKRLLDEVSQLINKLNLKQ